MRERTISTPTASGPRSSFSTRTSTETMRLSSEAALGDARGKRLDEVDVPGGDDGLHGADEVVIGRHLVDVVALRRHAAGNRRLDGEAHLLGDALLLVVDADGDGQH